MTPVDRTLRRILVRVWWIEFPLIAMLVVRFSYERACLDPYELLRPVMQQQTAALGIAAVYVGAYVWVVTAAVLTARMWHHAGPSVSQLHAIWNDDLAKVHAMAGVLLLEQVPRAVWGWLYGAIGAC